MTPDNQPVTIESALQALETETAKLDSLQSLCGVVAEAAGTVSEHATIGAVLAIMNNVESIKDRLGDVGHQLMTLRKEGARHEPAREAAAPCAGDA
jgi:hypothetical protein